MLPIQMAVMIQVVNGNLKSAGADRFQKLRGIRVAHLRDDLEGRPEAVGLIDIHQS